MGGMDDHKLCAIVGRVLGPLSCDAGAVGGWNGLLGLAGEACVAEETEYRGPVGMPLALGVVGAGDWAVGVAWRGGNGDAHELREPRPLYDPRDGATYPRGPVGATGGLAASDRVGPRGVGRAAGDCAGGVGGAMALAACPGGPLDCCRRAAGPRGGDLAD